jgi:hypothetical protein
MAYAGDLKSPVAHATCGFKSRPGHHLTRLRGKGQIAGAHSGVSLPPVLSRFFDYKPLKRIGEMAGLRMAVAHGHLDG